MSLHNAVSVCCIMSMEEGFATHRLHAACVQCLEYCINLYDEKWLPDIRKHVLVTSVFGNTYHCE